MSPLRFLCLVVCLCFAAPVVAQDARVSSLADLNQVLTSAKAGDTVRIKKGVEIALKDTQIVVPEKVTLNGEGATITAAPVGDRASIALKPGARLTGVRMVGPNPLFKDIDSQPFKPGGYAVACADAEVDHCEIMKFQRGGIAMFRDSVKAHIHHNHLHDIAAYPVLIANGSGDGHIIEHNRIEWAWHAIASNGSRGSGYTARFNEFVRMPRPKAFEVSGPSPPNWCLDMHENNGAETKPARPATRLLVVRNNVFLAHPDVKVGDGSDLLTTNGLYPKHDIYVGPCPGVTTTADIHHNRFLMHEKTGSSDKMKPYGRAIRLVGLKGDSALEDDPQPAKDEWKVSIHDNTFGGAK
ncbi:MAG: hypothetical protein K1X78_15660 [Verrucomicrobiaceae bacterium]|nr:hypothetical protein [Verrucomicrobiaceae bacterium]